MTSGSPTTVLTFGVGKKALQLATEAQGVRVLELALGRSVTNALRKEVRVALFGVAAAIRTMLGLAEAAA